MNNEEKKPEGIKKFDTKVHITDPKTGKIVKVQDYILRIRNGEQRFERDGVEYYPDGTKVNPNARPKPKPSVDSTDLSEEMKSEILTLTEEAKKEIAEDSDKLLQEKLKFQEEKRLFDEEKKELEEQKKKSLEESVQVVDGKINIDESPKEEVKEEAKVETKKRPGDQLLQDMKVTPKKDGK